MSSLLQQYKNAMAAGREIDCYNNKIIFCERDSFMIGLTDMNVLWRNCILPLYEEGDLDIPHRVENYVAKLLATDDVLSIYGALECIRTYLWLHIYPDFPFEIDFIQYLDIAKQSILRNAEKFKHYKGKEFSSYLGTPFDIVAPMVGLDKIDPYANRPQKKSLKKRK